MHVSWVGLAFGLAYLVVVTVQMARVIARRSFGGIFSEEFALWVLTLPVGVLGEFLFKTSNLGRVAVYIVASLLNATAIYFLGMDLSWAAWKVVGP